LFGEGKKECEKEVEWRKAKSKKRKEECEKRWVETKSHL
jgi:hypothetical protein